MVEIQLADSETDSVEPESNAQLLGLIMARKRVEQLQVKFMCSELMWISNPLCFARYKHERRFDCKDGTCKTLVNSIGHKAFSPITG